MNTFVTNYFLSVFFLFLSENAFKKTMFWFFKHRKIAFPSLFCLICSLPSFTVISESQKERDIRIMATEAKKKRIGLDEKAFLPAPFSEPREGCQPLAPSLPSPAKCWCSCSPPNSQPRKPAPPLCGWRKWWERLPACKDTILFVLTCTPLPTPQRQCF